MGPIAGTPAVSTHSNGIGVAVSPSANVDDLNKGGISRRLGRFSSASCDVRSGWAAIRLKVPKMNKRTSFLLLAFSSVLAFGSVNAQVGQVTRLMTKDLPDVPGKEGMVESVAFAPGEASQPHRHNADLFVYVLEGSIVTQLKGSSPQTVHAGEVFYESPTDVHSVSRNASETQPAKLLVFYVKAKGAPPTVLLEKGEK